jgi:endogenous inhibitor of DNA gyrase (YacG/DUF329 family)
MARERISAQGIRYVACPRCGAQVAWVESSRYRPFCSERCKLIDLGQWASEQYRIPGNDAAGERSDDGGQKGEEAETEK